MATFPALEPDTREYDIAGDFPMVEEPVWPGVTVRYRTGYEENTAVGLVLILGFNRRPIAEILQIRAHYENQQGGAFPFTLPAVIWQGHDDPPVPAGTQWRYLEPPAEPAGKGARGSITVTLEAMAYPSDEP